MTSKDADASEFRKSFSWVIPFVLYYLLAVIAIILGILQMCSIYKAPQEQESGSIVSISVSLIWTCLIIWQMWPPVHFAIRSFDKTPKTVPEPWMMESATDILSQREAIMDKYLRHMATTLIEHSDLLCRLLDDMLTENDRLFLDDALMKIEEEFGNGVNPDDDGVTGEGLLPLTAHQPLTNFFLTILQDEMRLLVRTGQIKLADEEEDDKGAVAATLSFVNKGKDDNPSGLEGHAPPPPPSARGGPVDPYSLHNLLKVSLNSMKGKKWLFETLRPFQQLQQSEAA